MNGDGKAEILVCAVSEFAGRVYLFDGATRELLRELRSPNEVFNSGFGYRATGIEDVNGDGRGDILVATGSGENRVYVLDGATGEPIHTLPLRGHSVSSVPDVNGDGRPDLAVGTVDFGSRSGTVRIYDGASGTQLRTLNGGGFFGLSVSGIPDVNGDGAGDVIVGAWMDNRAYIHDGTTGARLHTLIAPGNPFRFGWVVNRLPDVDGDGHDDVVVAGFQDYNQSRIPADTYVFSGATGELLATLPGHSDYGGGRSIAGMPDINGDGLGEVLVANQLGSSSTGIFQAGQVSLYQSKGSLQPPALTVLGWTDDGFRLQLTGGVGAVYELQASEDLVNWTTVVNPIQGESATEFLDEEAKNQSRRFYRTRSAP